LDIATPHLAELPEIWQIVGNVNDALSSSIASMRRTRSISQMEIACRLRAWR